MRNYDRCFPSMLCLVAAATSSVTLAAEQAIGFDPITVKTGEEIRITLFNPSSEPLVLRVFAYNASENTLDDGPSFTLPPGKVRFFDFKVSKEFVGIGGVIEVVPDAVVAETKQAKPELKLEDILVSSVKSRGSLQHRGTTGQSQTLGYSFGASQAGGWFRSMQAQAIRVTASEWVASAQF